MRHFTFDPFMSKRAPDPDAVVKSSPACVKCGRCPYASATEKAVAKGSGDFTDCMDRIVPAMGRKGRTPDDPEAFCAWHEHEQTGHWPGEKRGGIWAKNLHSQGVEKAESQRPPDPCFIELDGDQDTIARSDKFRPTESFRPGYVTDAAEEAEPLFMTPASTAGAVGKGEVYRPQKAAPTIVASPVSTSPPATLRPRGPREGNPTGGSQPTVYGKTRRAR